MIPLFDIFRVSKQGPRWIEPAVTLEAAEKRVRELLSTTPSEHLIVSQHTGDKLSIKPDGSEARTD